MNVKIYQIDSKLDGMEYEKTGNDYAFIPYNWLQRRGLKIKRELYKMVWDTKTEETNLNSLYALLNHSEKPSDYKGRSLSVSDVIIMGNEAYYVDNIGFKKINWEM